MIVALSILELVILGFIAGVIGSLTGLGGGVVIIPMLTLALGVPIEFAAGASLVSSIATSSGAASAYVKEKLANIRIGMSLEIATTIGAIIGSLMAAAIYAKQLGNLIYVLFGIVLILSIYPSLRAYKKRHVKRINKDWTTGFFQLSGSYYDKAAGRRIKYSGYRWWLGEGIMSIAGILSGLLGIGSGALKDIGMDWGMKLPIKVTTSTSNFMIGVTAAASSAVYWYLGYIRPVLVGPILVGVLAGSYVGSKVLPQLRGGKVRLIFMAVLVVLGMEMVLRGIGVT